MRKFILFMLACFVGGLMFSCKAGKGCPSNGRNLGAERLLSGDKKAEKLAKKAGKFKGGKF